MKRIYRNCLIVSILITVLVIIVSGILYVKNNLPNTIFVNSNQTTQYDFAIPVSLNVCEEKTISLTGKNSIHSGEKGDYNGTYKLFGLFTLKKAKVKVIDKTYVYPIGLPIGLYLKTQGVMIIDAGKIENEKGEEISPAEGKVFAGEYIVKFNETRISNKAQLQYLISENENKDVSLTIRSDIGVRKTVIKPVKAKSGEYMLGIWVRDDSQGIGSMSFIFENRYYALGHGISDIDTGKLLSSHEGTIYNANIWGVKKGERGTPGGLCGSIKYNKENIIGTIESNSNCGINGTIYIPIYKKYKIKKMEMAFNNEIKKGKAKIQFIINGKLNMYNIEIIEINRNNKEKNMIIKIVDKDLLDKTNGIVQGMSGCPIIQNNKVIGAVTHVMVNDPTKGYGIFAENMISQH